MRILAAILKALFSIVWLVIVFIYVAILFAICIAGTLAIIASPFVIIALLLKLVL